MRGPLAAPAQGVALLDAEPVLLVDDHEPQLGEPDPVLDQRVRADDDPGLAGLRLQQRLRFADADSDPIAA